MPQNQTNERNLYITGSKQYIILLHENSSIQSVNALIAFPDFSNFRKKKGAATISDSIWREHFILGDA